MLEAYIKKCNICLALKADFLIDFVIELSISANWKSDIYNSILVIVDQ